MRRDALWLVVFGLLCGLLRAEPFVAGFDRFHGAEAGVEGGRLLYNELGCVNCHGGSTGLPVRRGPELATLAQRARGEWVTAFIADPERMHPGSTMPRVLHGVEEGAFVALRHYLASIGAQSAAKPVRINHVNASRGGVLFHMIGCVACHEPGKDFVPPDGAPQASDFTHRSAAFPDLKAKYSLASLSAFLLDPLKVRGDGRMPAMGLEAQDAADLAGHLLGYEGSNGALAPQVEPLVMDGVLVEKGRALAETGRCASCHTLPRATVPGVVALKRNEGGCLSVEAAGSAPRYRLSEVQRAALRLFLSKKDEPVAPVTAARLSLQALNCVACHERDGQGGPDTARKAYFQGDHNLGDTGRYPPPLTAVGRKLRPEWFAKVLSGGNRVRPYLQTRMPVFGPAADPLVKLLGGVDALVAKTLPGGDDTAGRRLLGTTGGAGCITCHRWGTRPSLGIQGLDLSNIGQRLQEGWLREYLLNPAAYRPGTLMPSFWPDGKSFNAEILGGDTDRQIASIHSFAKSANGEPEGFPNQASGEFEIVPKDRPVVQRTFMEGAGTHAILVGFPTGVHLAYDGQRAGPAVVWKGRFFDAYTTWFSRFPVFEKPPGERVVQWPQPGTARFDGYRLDARGNPIFVSTRGGVRVEELFEGVENGLRRTVTWAPTPDFDPAPAHPEGVERVEEPGGGPGRRVFTYQWK